MVKFRQIWSHWQPICFLNMPFPLFLRIMQPSFCCKSRQNQNLNNLIFETIYNCRWYQLFRLWAFAYRGMIEMYQITFANVCPWKFYLDWRLLRIKQHLDIPSVVGFLDLDRWFGRCHLRQRHRWGNCLYLWARLGFFIWSLTTNLLTFGAILKKN